jgi:hypothetical protein
MELIMKINLRCEARPYIVKVHFKGRDGFRQILSVSRKGQDWRHWKKYNDILLGLIEKTWDSI